jgi:chromosome segregation ATPase
MRQSIIIRSILALALLLCSGCAELKGLEGPALALGGAVAKYTAEQLGKAEKLAPALDRSDPRVVELATRVARLEASQVSLQAAREACEMTGSDARLLAEALDRQTSAAKANATAAGELAASLRALPFKPPIIL